MWQAVDLGLHIIKKRKVWRLCDYRNPDCWLYATCSKYIQTSNQDKIERVCIWNYGSVFTGLLDGIFFGWGDLNWLYPSPPSLLTKLNSSAHFQTRNPGKLRLSRQNGNRKIISIFACTEILVNSNTIHNIKLQFVPNVPTMNLAFLTTSLKTLYWKERIE